MARVAERESQIVLGLDPDPAALWQNAYAEAGRFMRHDFWVADLADVDWDAVLDSYRPLLDRIAGPADFADVLWEIFGELGTSHAYVSRRTAALLDRPATELNVITLHLGNGASACAVAAGRSVATSMGLLVVQLLGAQPGDHPTAGTVLAAMVGGGHAATRFPALAYVGIFAGVGVTLAIHWAMRDRPLAAMVERTPWPVRALALSLMIVAIVVLQGPDRAFIYFQF